MDILSLDLLRTAPVPGAPDGPTRDLRRRLAQLAGLAGRATPGGVGGATAARRGGLLVFTAVSIVLGLSLLAWTSITSAPLAGIDPGFPPGTVLSGPTGGLLLWLLYGLLGSLRTLRTPGGGTMTFHLPFVGAAMVLGGPTAGAWVAFLSSIERRELESQPWYGILANHSIIVIGAVAGGLATQAMGQLLGANGHGPATLAAAATGTMVLATVATGLGIATVLLREDLTLRSLVELVVGHVGRVTVVEMALVVVLAMAFTELGWWSPLLVGGFVLLVWDNHPMPAPDALTGLLNAEGFGRRLEAGLGLLRRGVTPGATVFAIDLDRFHDVNNTHGHAVGDEVLREIAVRLQAQGRRLGDLAGRLGGDEFALFLPGLTDPATAMRRADDVVASLSSPIATTVGVVTVGASVGVLVLEAWGGVPSAGTILHHADQAMFHAKFDGGRIHLYDSHEPAPSHDTRPEGRR